MPIASTGWILLVLAFVLANLPFLNHKLFALIALPRPKSAASAAVPAPQRSRTKPFALILLEWALGYAALLALGTLMENALGQVQPQGWEFYVVTLSLFATLAFPGFVWRYFWQR